MKKKCVYKIICRDKEITEFYIGSSMEFEKRKKAHKVDCNNLNQRTYCLPLYMFINVNGGWENWEIEVIKEYKFITKKELNMNEQYYINLNSQSAKSIKTQKDYDKEHNNKKSVCDICNLEMNSKNINRHKRNIHKILI